MAKKWKELLQDRNSYPDDFVISSKDGSTTFSLGELRAQDAESEGAVSRRLSEIEKREKAVTDASVGMATMVERLSAATGLTTDELLEGKTPTKKTVAQSMDLDENDPLVGKLVKEIKALNAKVETANSRYDELKKNAIGPMLNTYLDDYYELQWERISGDLPKGSKVELKEALTYANENGLKDKKGRFDLRKAARDLTYDARVEQAAEAKAETLRKKMEDERVLAAAPKPSQFGQRIKPAKSLMNEKGQVKNLDEVLNDAVNDTDLWKGIAQA